MSCKAGFIHRKEKRECTSIVPRPPPQLPTDSTRDCERDEDCAHLPHGYCTESPHAIPHLHMTCKVDADCGEGRFCAASLFPRACYALPSPQQFDCQSQSDTCRGPADCEESQMDCVPTHGGRQCILSGRCSAE